MVSLEAKLKLIMMDDIVHRRFLDKNHRSYVEDFGVYVIDFASDGSKVHHILSRQMVLFCVERRKSWRLLQSRAGVEITDYFAQKEMIAKIDAGELTVEEFVASGVV